MANILGDVTGILPRLPRPPAPPKANPGPPPRGSYNGSRRGASAPAPAPPPDMFAGWTGPAVDAAKQLVQNFLTSLGYPSGLDANALSLDLLKSGLLNNPLGAYNYLYYLGHGMTDDLRRSHPGAQFGMDQNSYQTRKDSIDATFKALLGSDATMTMLTSGMGDLNNIYLNAFRGNWSQQQILQQIMTSTDASVQALVAAQPWLAAGQGEQQIQQQYASLYGSAPVGTQTLASWFKFNQGTQTLGRGTREAQEVATPQPSVTASR